MKNTMNSINIFLLKCFVIGLILLSPLISDAEDVEGLGEVSDRISTGLMGSLRPFINGVCYIVGFIFLIVSIRKFQALRLAPHEITFTTPLMYFVLGISFLLLPFVYLLVQKVGAS